jgi:amidophosphoribosyltransferase
VIHARLGHVPDNDPGTDDGDTGTRAGAPPVEADTGAGDGKPREACGVFGVYAPGRAVAHLTFDGLYALQHRGQESAGMTVSDGRELITVKDMGLVTNVFNEYRLAGMAGDFAIGHTRYSTTGTSTWHNAQPVWRTAGTTSFALGHNGNLTNVDDLAAEAGMLPGTAVGNCDSTTDSDIIAELLAQHLDAHPGTDLADALMVVLPKLRGAFSLVLLETDRVIGVRDPNGFRPLCLGKLDDAGWVLASESPALDVVGASFVRELDPGELVVISAEAHRTLRPWPAEMIDPKLCLFEFVYLARPDTRLYGQELHSARLRMGELLAETAPVAADMVMGVPESGVPAAEGYARRSGIPYGQGLVKNRYIGRTFITPDQAQRAQGVRRKLNPLKEAIAGQRLVVVDDSIVRGTTTRAMVRMLREAGALEVHLRVSSPPYRWPCFYGLDTGSRSQLIAASLEVNEICEYIGATSLAYLSLEALKEATGAPRAGFCDACLTGNYPVPVSLSLDEADASQAVATSEAATALAGPGPVAGAR